MNDFHIYGHEYNHVLTCTCIHHPPSLSSSSTAAEVPFNVSIIASTSVGKGVEYLSIIFTQEGCKFELQCNIHVCEAFHICMYMYIYTYAIMHIHMYMYSMQVVHVHVYICNYAYTHVHV